MTDSATEHQYSGGVYTPSQPNLAILVILFKDGNYLAHKEVQSVAEGEAELARALGTLPELEDGRGI
jgi:hypothetical protein